MTDRPHDSVTGMELELEITNVAHGGVFVARHDGRVIFVSDTLPGERVLARVVDDQHPSFWRADTVGVLDASPHRRPHVWSAAAIDRRPEDRAGGAEFGHIELDHQRELKRQVIADAFARMAGLETSVRVEAAAGDDSVHGERWRTRVRLHVAEDGRVGPYAARSHQVIPVHDLPLATAGLQAVAPLDGRFPGAESIDIVDPGVGPARVTVNDARRRRSRGRRASRVRPELIRELVGDREFQLDLDGFWQVHHSAAITLSSAVRDMVDPAFFDPGATNLDLYGGVGLFAAALGDRFGRSTRITSVESSAAATGHATHNLADWAGATAVTDRVENYVRRLAAEADPSARARMSGATVVLDPPRSGAGKQVVSALSSLRPAQIVYVACDPVALARDVALLSENGYGLRDLRAFDLFPHTHHVEAVARFTM